MASAGKVWSSADLREHEGALRAAAQHLCRKAWETDDLVQDVFERALRHLSAGHEPPENLRAWLVAVLRNVFIDRQRRRTATPASDAIADAPAPEREPEPPWARVSLDDVRAAIATLEPNLRRVFELHYFEGRRYREIAAALGMPENTVASRLSRARAAVKAALEGGAR